MTPTSEKLSDLPVTLDFDQLSELESYIIDSMHLAGIPGTSIAIVQDDALIYTKGFGVRELGKDAPISPDTLFMIGSSTKPLTTLMMATVVDDGLMNWDTPVTDILPSFAVGDPELTQKLAIRHLVCACSGMPGKDASLLLGNVRSAEDLIRSIQTITPVSELGKQFHYSNQMVAAGGYLAALAAGGPSNNLAAGYISAMQTRVFDPIGMERTTLSLARVENSGDFALPHGLNLAYEYEPMPLLAEDFVQPILPSGAVWSTAQDMARMLRTELNQGIEPDGKRIVSMENLTRTWQPEVPIDAPHLSYALGWMTENYQGKRLIHHSGASMGFSAELAFMPECNLGIVILANAESASSFVYAIRQRFLELAFDLTDQNDLTLNKELESSRRNVLNFASMLKKDLDESAVMPYLGKFTNPELGNITFRVENGKLLLYSESIALELCQYASLSPALYTICEVPLVTLGQLAFQFKLDATGHPIVVLLEKNIPEPFVFMKVGLPDETSQSILNFDK